MSVFEWFESMRRANTDWYTANPLGQLGEEDLAWLAGEAGMMVEELREHITKPHIEMTCPLCGRPSTHLVNCTGCGKEAWGYEWELEHGEDARDLLRERFKSALTNKSEEMPIFSLEQVNHAAKHAFQWGGCMVCSECWHNTLPVEAYQTCPIRLMGERTLEPEQAPIGLFYALMNVASEEEHKQVIREWTTAAWKRWADIWNTVADQEARQAVARWRHLLLKAVWHESLNSKERY